MEGTFQNAFNKGRACSNELLRGTSLPADRQGDGGWPAAAVVFHGKVRVKGRDSGAEPPGLNSGSATLPACLGQVTEMLPRVVIAVAACFLLQCPRLKMALATRGLTGAVAEHSPWADWEVSFSLLVRWWWAGHDG